MHDGRFLGTTLLLISLAASCGGGSATVMKLDGRIGDQDDLGLGSDAGAEVSNKPDASAEVLDFTSREPDGELASQPDVNECASGSGCFGDPCEDNSDCIYGFCVEHLGESVCTQSCVEECPAGWSCQEVSGGGPDVLFLCISDLRMLCRPCAANADCTSTTGGEDVCLDYGLEGSFCGGQCSSDQDCPEDYLCEETTTVDGVATTQCVAVAGVCECSGKAVALGAWTPCKVTNEWGACGGKRFCLEAGLTQCDAIEPAEESCNGLDDDCDGAMDEAPDSGAEGSGLCDDGNPCSEDLCQGEEGCLSLPQDGVICEDSDPCTVDDVCSQSLCTGVEMLCDDENLCTDDGCGEEGECLFVSNQLECDDGDPCTLADECSAGECSGTAVACDCVIDADCNAMEDGDLCTGVLACDTTQIPHQCILVPGSPVECPEPSGDDAFCLAAACAPATGECSFVPAHEGLKCDDQNACTMAEHCQDGVCTGGIQVNCNDGNLCTDDACDQEAGCGHTANSAPCGDGNSCTTGDICSDGTCVGLGSLNCNDGNLCTADSCDPVLGCIYEALAIECNDGNPCTTGDLCQNGSCNGTGMLDCDDGNTCTVDKCTIDAGCVHEPSGILCNDGNACTDDTCHPQGGCVYVANSDPCIDGNACTTGDICTDGTCVGPGILNCNDGNFCTADFCDPVQGCVYLPNTSPCDDGDACTVGDKCGGGDCGSGEPLICDDEDLCTDDSCDVDAGCVYLLNTAPCDDGDLCTLSDQCLGGACMSGAEMACEDASTCTLDECVDGACLFSPLPSMTACPGGFCDGAGECVTLFGGGVDGDLVVEGQTLLEEHGALSWALAQPANSGADTLVLAEAAAGLDPGDEVLVIVLQGTPADHDSVGQHEFATVASVDGTSVLLNDPLLFSYGAPTQPVAVLRVPHFMSVQVLAGGQLTTAPWNGTKGGVIAFRVAGELAVAATGSIDASFLGYRQGNGAGTHPWGEQGEGLGGTGSFANGTNLGAGGGGISDEDGMGGGGGGYGTAGTQGASTGTGFQGPGGLGGEVHGEAALTHMRFGGGGGQAGADSYLELLDNSGAGRSGGMVYLFAKTVVLDGNMLCTGQPGKNYTDAIYQRDSGAGAGGSIRLATFEASGAGSLNANGGPVGSNGGGGGGVGRIRIDSAEGAVELSATPAAYQTGL